MGFNHKLNLEEKYNALPNDERELVKTFSTEIGLAALERAILDSETPIRTTTERLRILAMGRIVPDGSRVVATYLKGIGAD